MTRDPCTRGGCGRKRHSLMLTQCGARALLLGYTMTSKTNSKYPVAMVTDKSIVVKPYFVYCVATEVKRCQIEGH